MESSRPQFIILADTPAALCLLFGISFLERLLRVGQRLGFREAILLSNAPEEVTAHLAKPSWARAQVALSFRPRNAAGVRVSEVATGADRILIVSAGFYYDARLLKTMAEQNVTTMLIDSAPPPECLALWKNQGGVFRAAALLEGDWLSRQDHSAALMDQLSSDAGTRRIEACDAARQPTYVMPLRKHIRPVFFPAPSPDLIAVAERFPRDAAQNGTLDFPGWVDAPIENWIVARLCLTSIRPNQITFVTALIGLLVTALFARGHLWLGLAFGFAVEVLDGVDGKLARTKVETTAAGDWEHVSDYCIELSWWAALAYHFHAENLRAAYWLLLLLVGSDLVDRLAKRVVKKKVGRNLDDVSNFDRFVRCIGTRRNINIWILAAALVLGDAVNGFVLICWWGAATAAAHVVRAWQIRFGRPVVLDAG
jgi:phosphatidylglycerophosphate synthase